VTDTRCKQGEDIEHIDYCTCGIIELDEEENPVLFYNKRNQIFFLENGPQVFLPPHEVKSDMSNFNTTNKLLRRFKSLGKEQRQRYVELGRICQECEFIPPPPQVETQEKTTDTNDI
jgi:endo-1,4-beta-mannosidase